MSDIRVGDYIHARLHVVEVEQKVLKTVCSSDICWISPSDIVHVEPRLEPLKVGDRVQHPFGAEHGHVEIRAICGKQAWVGHASFDAVYDLSDLERVNTWRVE